MAFDPRDRLLNFYTVAGTLIHEGGAPIKYKGGGSGELEIVSEPREARTFDGRGYVMERASKCLNGPTDARSFTSCLLDAVTGDFALIKGWKGDSRGNIVFRGTARNFNPDAAKAASGQLYSTFGSPLQVYLTEHM